jgi:putative heme-binding domain-containing protein
MNPEKTLGLLGRLLADSSAPVPLRERAASSLSGINEAGARQELLRVLPTAPGPIQTAIAVGLAARKPGTEALLDAIATGKASARLLQDPRVARPLANSNIEGVGTRIATLLKGLAPADERLRELLKRRRETFGSARRDPAQGAKVFAKICANCHQLGGKGERIGPQLDGVGVRGLDRLLEDVLDPSRNVDQAFRLTNLGLANGQQVSGLLLKEEGAVLVLADSQGKELRVPRETVEERSTSQLSPMPANLSDQISEPDFHDLLAYLLLQQDRPVVRTSH